MNQRIRLELFLIILPVLFSGLSEAIAESTIPGAEPVFLASVAPGSAAEKAGLATGDRLLRWRVPAGQGVPAAEGVFLSPWDPAFLECEASARGFAEITVRRSDGEKTVTIRPGTWNLSAKPELSPDIEALYAGSKQHTQQGRLKEGVDLLQQAALLAEAGEHTLEAAWLHFWVAETARKSQSPELCGEALARACRLAEATRITRLRASLLEWQGRLRFFQRDLPGSIDSIKQAVSVWEQSPEHCFQLARILISLGKIYQQQGEIESAGQQYKRALTLAELGVPDNLLSAEAHQQCGTVAWWRSEFDTAVAHFQKALSIHRRLAPGESAEAFDLNCLGLVSWRKGDLAAAESYFRDSLTIRQKIDPGSIDTATSVNNLGLVCLYQGDFTEAEHFFRQALDISRKADPGGTFEAQFLQNLGIVAAERGDLAKAEWYYNQSTSVFERLAPGSLELANALNNEAIVAHDQGDLQRSEQLHLRTLAIREKLAPDSLDLAHTLNNLGAVFYDQKDFSRSADYHRRAMVIREKVAPGGLEMAESLANLGSVADQQSDLTGAENYYRRSLELFRRQSVNSVDVSFILLDLGDLAVKRWRPDAAEALFQEALAIQKRLAPESWAEAKTLHALGRLARERGQIEKAFQYFVQAVQALESQKGKLGGGKRTQEVFATRFADFYRDLVDVAIQLRRKTEAFYYLEKFRGQVLLRMMAERDLSFSLDAPPELIAEEKRLLFECQQIREKLATIDAARDSAQVEPQLNQWRALRENLDAVREKIRQASPRLAQLRYPEPLDVTGAASLLGHDTLLLSYCLGEKTLHIFALADGKVEVLDVPKGREEITRLVQSFRDQVRKPGAGSAPLERWSRTLYDLLLEPARRLLKKSRRLVICPDGPLHMLPFAALQSKDGTCLADWKPVTVILSATVLRESQNLPRPGTFSWQLTTFDNPDYPPDQPGSPGSLRRYSLHQPDALAPLPATAVEGSGICQLFPGTHQRFTGPAATEAEAKRQGRGSRYIHFACHGSVDESAPLDSGLVLSLSPEQTGPEDDGVLQVWEVLESVRLDADLVVLSACETGLGREMGGEGIIGLTRAFLYAGSKSVLASLWEVADETTAVMMQQFYRHLEGGLDRDEALRRAMLDLRRGPVTLPVKPGESSPGRRFDASHPFYWAGFFICGDWRSVQDHQADTERSPDSE